MEIAVSSPSRVCGCGGAPVEIEFEFVRDIVVL